jgi:Secretion system C-terminal sorting domain
MKKLYILIILLIVNSIVQAQTYCLTFLPPVVDGTNFRVNYTLVATVPVDASILIKDGNGVDIDIIPPAPGGLASYTGSFLSPTSAFTFEDLGVLASSNGATAAPLCIPLTVELVSFQAQNIHDAANGGTEGTNLLTWQTATESNTSHFDIERSPDGKTFEKIGETKSKGSNSAYQYVDKIGAFSTIYYRLKINDLDEKNDYSKIVSVKREGKLNVKIYPNPAQQFVTVEMDELSDATISVVDVLGKKLYQKTGVTGQSSIDLSSFSSGIYFIEIEAKDVKLREKIIKN